MTTPKLTKVETKPQLDPYHADTNSPTLTQLWFDPRDGTYGVSQEYDDNATPMDEWHGLILTNTNRTGPDEDEARAYLTDPDTVALLQQVIDGFEVVWNGSNMVGRMTDEARDAWERVCSEFAELPETEWSLWDTGDWINDTADVTATTTNDELRAMADELEAVAEMEKVILTGDPYDYLTSLRWELIEDDLTTQQAAHLIGISPAHLRRLLIAGKVRGRKVGRDWQINPAHIADVTRQRRR